MIERFEYGERVRGQVALLRDQSVTSGPLGNLTCMGSNNWGQAINDQYDAWGRLVQVSSTATGTPSETFGYDALGRQISLNATVCLGTWEGFDLIHGVNPVSERRAYYYDASGNVIQENETAGGGSVIQTQYVLSPVNGQPTKGPANLYRASWCNGMSTCCACRVTGNALRSASGWRACRGLDLGKVPCPTTRPA